jgi:hypothetical protein
VPRKEVEMVEKDGVLGARDVTQQGPRVRCKIDLGWDGNRCDGVGAWCLVLDEARGAGALVLAAALDLAALFGWVPAGLVR